MNIEELKSVDDWTNLWDNFDDSCHNLKDKLSDFPELDIRNQFIEQLMSGFRTLALIPIRTELWHHIDPKVIDHFFGFKKPMEYDERLEFIRCMDGNCKQSFLIHCGFIIENILEIILKRITGSIQGTYTKAIKKMLEILNFEESKIDPFLVLIYIRNTSHAGGFQTKQSIIFDIEGNKFEFKKDEAIQCAGWEHIFYILNKCLTTMEEIFFSININSIPGQPIIQY